MSDGVNTADRITIGLGRNVTDQMQWLQSQTGLSKTDIVNRAVSLYAFVAEEKAAGKELLVRDPASAEVERVHLL